jgi:hypothetical protein
MNDESLTSPTVTPQGKLLQDIKNHVVQIETMILGLTLYITILSILQRFVVASQDNLLFLLPFVLLAFVPALVRVTNPPSTLRARLSWGLSGAGIGATLGGGITGTLTGGLGAPAGALIGAPIGFLVGVFGGPVIEGGPAVMTQGEAREYVISKLKHYPGLTIPIVVDATELPPKDSKCCVFMFVSDGVIKCTKKDVHEWLDSGCWRSTPNRHSGNN